MGFQGVKDAELGNQKVQDATILLLKDAVSLPSVIQFDDILAFDTVKSCAKGKHANLIALCQLFLNGDVKDLDKFYKDKTKGAVFKTMRLIMKEQWPRCACLHWPPRCTVNLRSP